ncbi:hypothetical protein D3C71_1425280 [compost metagenome]
MPAAPRARHDVWLDKRQLGKLFRLPQIGPAHSTNGRLRQKSQRSSWLAGELRMRLKQTAVFHRKAGAQFAPPAQRCRCRVVQRQAARQPGAAHLLGPPLQQTPHHGDILVNPDGRTVHAATPVRPFNLQHHNGFSVLRQHWIQQFMTVCTGLPVGKVHTPCAHRPANSIRNQRHRR